MRNDKNNGIDYANNNHNLNDAMIINTIFRTIAFGATPFPFNHNIDAASSPNFSL